MGSRRAPKEAVVALNALRASCSTCHLCLPPITTHEHAARLDTVHWPVVDGGLWPLKVHISPLTRPMRPCVPDPVVVSGNQGQNPSSHSRYREGANFALPLNNPDYRSPVP